MTDETAKELAAAMNRLAAAIEKYNNPDLSSLMSRTQHVYHHYVQPLTPPVTSYGESQGLFS